MYECPNCAGNLKFDIAMQQLLCEHCETTMDPYSFQKEQDAEEYEATIYTCPQCGGEIISDDTTAATFCSFCGGSTILDSRISKEKRPAYIIPFQKTKEDCKKSYARMMRRAIFAPKELKDAEQVEKFRGIYMPYWVYSFEKNGPVSLPGTKTYRRGDYRYTKHYIIDCEVEESYKGFTFDASASFSDHLSGAIAPYDVREKKTFTPSYLSGFYADTNDVSKNVYEIEAEEILLQDAADQLASSSACKRYNVSDTSLFSALRPTQYTVELAMLPVWFLTYRNKDRVCYAVVNGQTGKAAADLPIDPVKYVLGSFVLAIPLFILLNIFFTFKPNIILLVAGILALVSMVISNKQMNRIFIKENGMDDVGLMSRMNEMSKQAPIEEKDKLAEEMAAGREEAAQQKKSVDKHTKTILIVLVSVFAAMYILPIVLRFGLIILLRFISYIPIRMIIALMLLCMIGGPAWLVWFFGRKKANKELKPKFKEKIRTLVKPLVGILAASIILLCNPVSDWIYYIGSFLCMASVLWAFSDIMKQHNALTTRKLPQLNKRGGDENA